MLQIKMTVESIKAAGAQFNGKMLIGTVRLKCWEEKVNPEVDVPVINETVSANYKEINGLTIDQQLNKWGLIIYQKAQTIINTYTRENTLKNNEKLQQKVNQIKTSLVG